MGQSDFDTHNGGNATRGPAAPFPPLVRPTPSYPDASTATLGRGRNSSEGRSSQPGLCDQDDLSHGPAIMSTCGDATGPYHFDPDWTSYDHVYAFGETIEGFCYNQQVQQHRLEDRALNIQSFSLDPRLLHIRGSTSSPNLFGNHQYIEHQAPCIPFPPKSSHSSSISAAPASINSTDGHSLDSKPPVLSSTTAALFNSSTVSHDSTRKSERTGAMWELVPYSLPFVASQGNGVVIGAASGSAAETSPAGAPLFLRSPTPTKRQRTILACDNCRKKKAKVSRPS